jgi:hypothetical protein
MKILFYSAVPHVSSDFTILVYTGKRFCLNVASCFSLNEGLQSADKSSQRTGCDVTCKSRVCCLVDLRRKQRENKVEIS